MALGSAPERLESGATWVHETGRRLTRFEPDSELSRFNAQAGRWVRVGQELEDLLRVALRAHQLSGGLVHAGVLDAMRAIGYTRPLREGLTMVLQPSPGPLPPLPETLEVAPGRARLAPGTGIDLGGLAKGWMADNLAARLGEDVIVNLGGDLFARGPGPEGVGWPIGMAGETVLLRDSGCATSGTWKRRWGRMHHLIDPRTGSPVESDLTEVSAVASTATDAEILAKTALILGSERAEAFLAGHALGWALA